MKKWHYLLTLPSYVLSQNITLLASHDEENQAIVKEENAFQANPVLTGISIACISLSLVFGGVIFYAQHKKNNKNHDNVILEHIVVNNAYDL